MKILNQKQLQVIKYLSQNHFFRDNFYFTGGTALAEIYLQHRLSEDLDFFSDDLYADEILLAQINKLKTVLGVSKIKYLKDKNRQRFDLIFSNNTVKLEFVYFPFGSKKSKKLSSKFRLRVDSEKSIGENKILALYENVEPKHIFDLYWICNKSRNLTLKKLHMGTSKKFGVEIDKVVFIEKALEAIDKSEKIKPLILPGFNATNKELKKFLITSK